MTPHMPHMKRSHHPWVQSPTRTSNPWRQITPPFERYFLHFRKVSQCRKPHEAAAKAAWPGRRKAPRIAAARPETSLGMGDPVPPRTLESGLT